MKRQNLSISTEYTTLPGLTRLFTEKQEIRGHFCPRILSNSFYLLVSFPARHIRRRQNLYKWQLSSASVKNELDHYHLLRRNTLLKITKRLVCRSWWQSMDFVFSLPISIWPTGCTGNQPSSDSYSYEYEPEGNLLYLHEANLTIFSLLHSIDNVAISLSLHGNVFTKPVDSTWNAQPIQLVLSGVYYAAMVPERHSQA